MKKDNSKLFEESKRLIAETQRRESRKNLFDDPVLRQKMKDNEEIKTPKSEASSALGSPSKVMAEQTIKKLEWQVQHEKDLG